MKNEKGFIPVVLAVVVVAVVAVGGYVMLQKNKSSTGKMMLPEIKLPGAGLNPNCELKDPDLCKYVNKFSTMTQFESGFSGRTVTTDKSGKKSESLWEMEGTGKSHFVTYDAGKELFNTIIIGDTTYTKDMKDNKWWKYVAKKEEGKETEGMFDPEKIKKEFADAFKEEKDKTTYKKIGKEACGSLTCFKYQMMNPDVAVTEYLYFDDREYLMRKMRIESEGSVTETVYDYNKVSVKEPSPVKEGEPGFNTLFDVPTSEEQPEVNAENADQFKEDMLKMLEKISGMPQEEPQAGE